MNDDHKDPNSKNAGDPNADADGNPWDDDDGGGRTLATDGPSFELPSNVPSPISIPPPAIPKAAPTPAARPRSPTMMGFGPMGPPLPGASPGAPSPPARTAGVIAPAPAPKPMPASARGLPAAARVPAPQPMPARSGPSAPRVPVAAPAARAPAPAPAAAPVPEIARLDEPWDDDAESNQDDGPTMAGAPLMADLPVRDDVVNPRPRSPLASTTAVDKDAETMGLALDPHALPKLGDSGDAEETTRAVSREELLGHQESSQVVVGDDDEAHGDEATLAVAPGALGALGGLPNELATALANRPARQPSLHDAGASSGSAPAFPAAPPAFPSPPAPSQGGMPAHQSQPQQQAMPSWQGEAAQSYRNPPQAQMGMQQGYDPMQQPQQGHQSSPGMPSAPQGYPMQGPPSSAFGPNPNAPTAGGTHPMPQQQQWMPPPPATGSSVSKRFTPQVIMLIVVGAVCLSIFVIGIVLFVTTNFQRP